MYDPDEGIRQVDGTRDMIREKAESLFEHYGYSKTSIGDIAKSCSMSPGNLYRFFRNKQAIGQAVVECFFDLQTERMHRARSDRTLTVENRLRATITSGVAYLVETMNENPRLFEMTDTLCDDPEGEDLLRRHRDSMSELLSDLVLEGVGTGELNVANAPRAGHDLLLCTSAFWMPQALRTWHDRDQILNDLERVLNLVLSALRTRA